MTIISKLTMKVATQATAAPSGTEQGIIIVGGAPAAGILQRVALNPQPLPPKAGILGKLANRLDAVALNPQPLPAMIPTNPVMVQPDLKRALGKYPTPLGSEQGIIIVGGTPAPGIPDPVALNPQPLLPTDPPLVRPSPAHVTSPPAPSSAAVVSSGPRPPLLGELQLSGVSKGLSFGKEIQRAVPKRELPLEGVAKTTAVYKKPKTLPTPAVTALWQEAFKPADPFYSNPSGVVLVAHLSSSNEPYMHLGDHLLDKPDGRGFKIYRSTSGGPRELITELKDPGWGGGWFTNEEALFLDKTAQPGITYTYYVIGVDGSGKKSPAAEVTITP